MPDEDFNKLLLETFTSESNEHVRSITAGLMELKESPAPARRREIVEGISRDAHSLKGAAGIVGMVGAGGAVTCRDIASIGQGLESIFAQWKSSAVAAPPETFNLLHRALVLLGILLQDPGADIQPAERMMVTRTVQELAAVSSAADSER